MTAKPLRLLRMGIPCRSGRVRSASACRSAGSGPGQACHFRGERSGCCMETRDLLDVAVDLLKQKESVSTAEMAAEVGLTRQAVLRHVAVLVRSGDLV